MINWLDKRYQGIIEIDSRKIEVLYENPCHETKPLICMLICHPHPGQGGNMYNKVVATLSKAALHHEIASFRFQFSGVGQTDGVYENFDQELNLFEKILKFIQLENFEEIILAGFSFGGAIVLRSDECTLKKIVIAPAWHFINCESLDEQSDIFLIQSIDDEIIDINQTFENLKKIKSSKLVSIISQNRGHFFKQSLHELAEEVIFSISSLLKKKQNKNI